jgi:hypothetical protein
MLVRPGCSVENLIIVKDPKSPNGNSLEKEPQSGHCLIVSSWLLGKKSLLPSRKGPLERIERVN